MSETGSAHQTDAQWDVEIVSLARDEYSIELQKTRSLAQASGSILSILAGVIVLKWAMTPPVTVTIAHMVALGCLAVVTYLLVNEDQMRIPLKSFVHTHELNTSLEAWRHNVAVTYEKAVIQMRGQRQAVRYALAGAVGLLVLLALFGLI